MLSLRIVKAAGIHMKYVPRSKFLKSLVHKKNFGLIRQVDFKMKYLFCQVRNDTSFELELTRPKPANDD